MLLFFALLLPISMVAMEQNNGVFSFKLQDVTVKDIFKYIEKNSEYIFLYSTDKNLLKKINVDVNKKDITQVLDEILKNTTLIYDIDGKQIIIREKNASEKSQQKTTQKKKTIRGIVSDDSTQEPIIGATIRVNGSMTGTTSNIEGDFVLECAVGDTLTVSFVGYQDRSVLVKSGNIYAIALKESAAELGEVVVTAFGVGQKKESLVGSIQQIKPQELKVPSSSLSTAFAGRMAGVIAVQRSGEPGADGANFWIRGKSTFNGNTSALIIMDGVEISSTELNALDPEVIESFSILKDATATALYGTRGANGVMIVATKNGKNLDKPIINFRLEGAISTMTRVPNMVDGPTYMKMFNEAVSRPGCDVSPYSQEKIDGTIAGLNPYIYPNVDWFDEIFNKSAFSERANFNIRGGSSKMDYFMSASFKHSNGHLKSLSKDYFSYNNNVRNYNYDFINNLNISATRTTKISLGLNLSVADKKSPLMDVNDIFQLSMEANPVDFPVRFPANMSDRDFVLWGDKPGGIHGQGWYRNPVAEYVTGYKTNLRRIGIGKIVLHLFRPGGNRDRIHRRDPRPEKIARIVVGLHPRTGAPAFHPVAHPVTVLERRQAEGGLERKVRSERHGLLFAGIALFGRNEDHAVGGLTAVQGGGRGTLEDRDALDILGVEVRNAVAAIAVPGIGHTAYGRVGLLGGRIENGHTVDHIERLVVAGDRPHAADAYLGRSARTRGVLVHLHAGRLARKRQDQVGILHRRELRPPDLIGRIGQVGIVAFEPQRRHDHLGDRLHILLQHDFEFGTGSRPDTLVDIPQTRDIEHGTGQDGDREFAFGKGRDPVRGTPFDNGSPGDGIARFIGDTAVDNHLPGRGLGMRRHVRQQAQAGKQGRHALPSPVQRPQFSQTIRKRHHYYGTIKYKIIKIGI